MPRRQTTTGVTIGAVGGVVGGLLGGGAGVLFVPALDRFTGLSRARVHGTSTIANIAVCVGGSAVYALGGGAVDLRVGAGLTLGGIVGGFWGARLLARASERLLRVLLIAILLLTAAKLYLDAAGVVLFAGGVVAPSLAGNPWFLVPVTVALGVVIGAWSGAMGLGGGLLAVPTMVLLFGTELHTAAGTSLVMFLPNSIAGAIVHVRQGTGSPRWGALLSVGALPGTAGGALLGLALDAVVLGLVFGTFALTMAVREIHGLVAYRRRVIDHDGCADPGGG